MPDVSPYLSSLAFDPAIGYPAIGAVVLALVLAVIARRTRRRPVSVWLWTLAALAVGAGLTALVLSVVTDSPRDTTLYAAPLAGLLAAVVVLPVAALLFSESRRPPFDVRHAVGRRAQVYQAVPGRGAGVGRVRVHAKGRSVLLSAATPGPDLPRYAFVRVRDGKADGRVLVEAEDGAA